jgi:hypothetical protein
MADPAAQRTVPPSSDGGPAGARPGPATRPRAIDATRAPEDLDVAALAQRIAGRLDQVLDEHALLRRQDEAEARHEQAVRVWTEAIARGAKADVVRQRALASTLQRGGGVPETVELQEEASPTIDAPDEVPSASATPAEPVVPDVHGTDAKLQTVRRRLEGRRAVASRAPPRRTPFWRRRIVADWVRWVAWGTVIVALSVVVSIVVL